MAVALGAVSVNLPGFTARRVECAIMSETIESPSPERRGFLKQFCAMVIGGIVGLVPAVAGLVVFFDPIRRKSQGGKMLRVTTLDALPADGVPRKFSVIASRTDAWNRFPDVPVGAVYIRRSGEKDLHVLNVTCPHAGCFVDYRADRDGFLCPCHNSLFNVDGTLKDPRSPSPRALDGLEWEIRNQNEVWVKFQNYEAGRKEKIPVA